MAGCRGLFYKLSGGLKISHKVQGVDYGKGVAMDGSSNVVVAGRVEGTVDFGGGLLTSAGAGDIFVLKLAP